MVKKDHKKVCIPKKIKDVILNALDEDIETLIEYGDIDDPAIKLREDAIKFIKKIPKC